MEHFFPAGAAERLAAFLGNPPLSPFGEIIPPAAGGNLGKGDLPITILGIEECGEITRMEIDPAGRAFLIAEGLLPGQIVKVLAISSSGSRLIQINEGHSVNISGVLANALWVKKIQETGKKRWKNK